MADNLQQNLQQLLSAIAGAVPLEPGDAAWRVFNTLPQRLSKVDAPQLHSTCSPYWTLLVVHNPSTGNYHKFLERTTVLLHAATTPSPCVPAINAVALLSSFMQHITEKLEPHALTAFATGGQPSKHSAATSTAFVNLILQVIDTLATNQPTEGRTYTLQLQLVQLLLTMSSTQLYTPAPAGPWGTHPLTDVILTHASVAPQLPRLAEALLRFVVNRPGLPKDSDIVPKEVPAEAARSSSLGRAMSALRLWGPGTRDRAPLSASPLAQSSILLLLALMHHTLLPKHVDAVNPIHLQLRHLQDTAEDSTARGAPGASIDEEGPGARQNGSTAGAHGRSEGSGFLDEERGFAGISGPSVSFSALYDSFGTIGVDEPGTLLLYAMLRHCPQFKEYVLVRSDLDTLLLPILELLYKQQALESNHMYMQLIVLLILSQEQSFSETVHKSILASVPWYQERTVTKSTLGSLTIVVLCRTAQSNLFKHKDAYLHTSTLAALTNMAPYVTGMTSLAAQRLLTLTEMLAKHYQRLVNQQKNAPVGSPMVGASAPTTPFTEDGTSGDVEVFGNCLRMMLEIINIALLHGLQHNPELLYAIMHKQDLFSALHADPQFTELGHNIQCVYDYFNPKLDAAREQRSDWTVESVHEILKKELQKWRPGKLHQFPDLRFTYEEEAAPEEFFVPYVWSLVVEGVQIPFNPKAIALFCPSNPHTGPWKQGPSNASPAKTS